MKPDFADYANQVVANAKALADTLIGHGYKLVSGGTDSHLLLVDFRSKEYTGKQAEEALGAARIHVNKNTVPGEQRSPFVTSGVRIGTSALTSRGMGVEQMQLIADLINSVLNNIDSESAKEQVLGQVKTLVEEFPLYGNSGPG